jgi:hypothetical protein
MVISKPSTSSHQYIITDATISEIVNDSDSDEFQIGEDQNNEEPIYLSSSISNKEDKEIPPLQQEPEMGQKRKWGTTKLSDMELGWKQSTCSGNIPAFSGIQGLNPTQQLLKTVVHWTFSAYSSIMKFSQLFRMKLTDMQNNKSIKRNRKAL